MSVTRIPVGGEAPYEVLVGQDLAGELAALVGPKAAQVAVLCAPALRSYGEAVASRLTGAGLKVLSLEVPDGEAAKTVEVAARCWDALGAAAFTRTDAV